MFPQHHQVAENLAPSMSLQEEIFQAALHGNEIDLMLLLSSTDDMESLWPAVTSFTLHQGVLETPLIAAARNGHAEIIRILLCRFPVPLDERTKGTREGYSQAYANASALWFAAHRGDLEIVRLLVEGGADINIRKDSYTPLHEACAWRHVDVILYLIEHGAHAEAESQEEKTSLVTAIWNGAEKAVRMLLQRGTDPNLSINCLKRPLDYAVEANRLDMVNLLLTSGAKLYKDSYGFNLLLRAARQGNEDVVNCFVEHPAVPVQDKILALKMLGATLCLRDVSQGFQYRVWAVMDAVQNPFSVSPSYSWQRGPAVGNIMESHNLKDLLARRPNTFAIVMESMLILQRIPRELSRFPREDMGWLDEACGSLRHYGLLDKILPVIQHEMGVLKDASGLHNPILFLAVAVKQVFSMLEENRPPSFLQMKNLFNCFLQAYKVFCLEHRHWNRAHLDCETIQLCLKCISIMHILLSKDYEEGELKTTVKQFVQQEKQLQCFSSLHAVVKEVLDSPPLGAQTVPLSQVAVVSLLVHAGADIHARDTEGNTPLHSCVKRASRDRLELIEVAEVLLSYGAHSDFPNHAGLTPLDLIKKSTCSKELQSVFLTYSPAPLTCLAARVIVHHRLPYECLPASLRQFVHLHGGD